MKSLSIVFTGPQRVEVRQEDVPDPAANEIIAQTQVSLVSTGTESWCYRGRFDADTGWADWVKYPFYPGYSNVGKVVKTGKDVTTFREGDRVFSIAPHQQYATLSENSIAVKLPDYTSHEDATWSALTFITQTAVRHAEHAMGDIAAVIGLGPLGQLVTQYLRVLGLREILLIDTVQKRLDAALEHGGTHAFCGSAADAREFVAQHTEGTLADVVYDVTGHYAVFPHALKLVRNFGTLILLGDTPHPSRQTLTHDVLNRQIKIVGTHNAKLPPKHAYWTAQRQILLFWQYIHRGQMKVADLITHRYMPEQAKEVYQMLQKDRSSTLGVLFDWK